jgi:transcriptional regulator with XRE-family HTH domain
MKLGNLLRRARYERGLSLRDVAHQLGMNFSYLQRIEQGERFPSADYIERLADFLCRPPVELFNIISEDRNQFRLTRVDPKKPLTDDAIEARANRDRLAFLRHVGRDAIRLPKDRDHIPAVLCGLKVIYDDVLFGPDGKLIYAGLFPPGHTYQTESSIIVVAEEAVNQGSREYVSDQTKNFHVLHETGHYRLHWQGRAQLDSQFGTDRPLFCSSGDRSLFETQANLYASSFLMPRVEIFRILENSRTVNLRRFGAELCQYFGVEEWMLRFRLARIGIRIT